MEQWSSRESAISFFARPLIPFAWRTNSMQLSLKRKMLIPSPEFAAEKRAVGSEA
jgi:hypothetical protein